MHDPFQTHSLTGQYYGTPTPTNPLYAQLAQTNPAALLNPLASFGISPIAGLAQMGQGYPGIQGGINPLQLQLASILAQSGGLQGFGASPWAMGLQNPLLAAAYQNPLMAAGLLNSPWNPIFGAAGLGGQFAQQPQLGLQPHLPFGYPGIGQGISPFGQIGSQLAPQSWINQGGLFGGGQQPFGQPYPQLNARQFQPGMYPGVF